MVELLGTSLTYGQKIPEEEVIPVGRKVTIRMDKEFVDWWNELATAESTKRDEIIMLIAWWAWDEATKRKESDN